MIYLFILNLALIGLVIWREFANAKERRDLTLQIKSKTPAEYVEAKKELEEKPEKMPEEPEEVAVGDMEEDKFHELV